MFPSDSVRMLAWDNVQMFPSDSVRISDTNPSCWSCQMNRQIGSCCPVRHSHWKTPFLALCVSGLDIPLVEYEVGNEETHFIRVSGQRLKAAQGDQGAFAAGVRVARVPRREDWPSETPPRRLNLQTAKTRNHINSRALAEFVS